MVQCRPMTFSVVCAGAIFVPALDAGARQKDDSTPPALVMAAYLPDYQLEHFQVDREVLSPLTDLILFSVQPGEDGAIRDDHGLLSKSTRWSDFRDQAPRPVKLWLCVGGGGKRRSDGFFAMASAASKRARFVQALVEILLRHHFTGAELDWEHMDAARDLPIFNLLVRDLKKAFEPHGLRLSAAVADARQVPSETIPLLDRITLMSYDGPRHGSLEQATEKVNGALLNSIPPEKILLGFPLYARGPRTDDTVSLRGLVARGHLLAEADQDHIDGLRFGGIATTRAKVRLVQEKRLSGIAFWELSQDAPKPSSLIRVVEEALRPQQSATTTR